MMTKHNGFTFIEAVTVVGIICILATLTVVAMKSLRVNGRDARRVNNISEIRGALSLYYSKYNQYPTAITPGDTFKVGNIIYLEKVPSNPVPRNDNSCNGDDYVYTPQNDNSSYTLDFCLGNGMAGMKAGANQATPEGINSYTAKSGRVVVSLDGNQDWTSEIANPGDPNSFTTFSVVLGSQPNSDVNIAITTSNNESGGTEATVDPTNITFTSSNWDQPQLVKATGYNDDIIEDQGTPFTVNFQTSSSDYNYNSLTVTPLPLTNYDECGDRGRGHAGIEAGKCSDTRTSCAQFSSCPNTYYCTMNITIDFEKCSSGSGCWRNSDCASNNCVGSNPPNNAGVCD